MNPKATQIAMEQMRRMTPEQMSRIQQQMGNITPEMMNAAMSQMGSMTDSDWDKMAGKMKSIDPEMLADMSGGAEAKFGAQQDYLYKGSLQLKEEGNKLYKSGKYMLAVEKYKKAKSNLEDSSRPDMLALRRACCLNLASCHLNMQQYDPCIQECSEVLSDDKENVKALYRRGQAYKALQKYPLAQQDLQLALELSTGDQEQTKMIQEKLDGFGAQMCDGEVTVTEVGQSTGPSTLTPSSEDVVIEEIPAAQETCTAEQVSQVNEAASFPGRNHEGIKEMVKENPEMLKDAAELMSKMSDEDLVTMGKTAGFDVSPEMVRAAQAAMSDMDTDTLKQMASMAGMMSSRRGDRVFDVPSDSFSPAQQSSNRDIKSMAEMYQKHPEAMKQQAERLSQLPQEELDRIATETGAPAGFRMTPEMAKEAADSLASMDPDQIKAMAKMAEHMAVASGSHGSRSSNTPLDSDTGTTTSRIPDGMLSPDMMKAASEMMSKLSPEQLEEMTKMAGSIGNSGSDSFPSGVANSLPSDPSMLRSMFKVMRSMDDETVANMMVSSGMCSDHGKARDMAHQLKSMSDTQAEMMIKAANVMQSGVAAVKKTKEALMGRSALILAIIMIIVGVLLRYLGWM